MTEPIKVYVGHQFGDHWIGITEDQVFVSGQGDQVTPVGGWGDHPLATPSGIEMLGVLLQVQADWHGLTRPQRRCLLDPTTRTALPWRALVGKGLAADDGGMTPRGEFLRLAREFMDQSRRAA